MSYLIKKEYENTTLKSFTVIQSSIKLGSYATLDKVENDITTAIKVKRVKQQLIAEGRTADMPYHPDMPFHVCICTDKIIFWSPFSITLLGKIKEKSGVATIGYCDCPEITSVYVSKDGIILQLNGIALTGAKFQSVILIQDVSEKLQEVAQALAKALQSYGCLSEEKAAKLSAFGFAGYDELELSSDLPYYEVANGKRVYLKNT